MNLRMFKKSLGYAMRGFVYVFRNEQNFRLQFFISILVLLISALLPISKNELILVLLLIFTVLGLELLNSAIEKFLDVLKPRMTYQAGTVKDIMASVVFLASCGAVIIGALIFWPYLVEFISQ